MTCKQAGFPHSDTPGSKHASFDPWISEWGNPAGVMPGHPVVEHMDRGKRTEGTETSKYLEEERTTVIP